MVMLAWLKCEISLGQFDNEVSVRGTDYAGEVFACFVPRAFVQVEEVGDAWTDGKLQVEVLQTKGDKHLVYLPTQTFSNGQSITVTNNQLEMCERECANDTV